MTTCLFIYRHSKRNSKAIMMIDALYIQGCLYVCVCEDRENLFLRCIYGIGALYQLSSFHTCWFSHLLCMSYDKSVLSFSSYVGRKVLNWETEKLLPGVTKLVRPGYSYWTLGYLISLRGAKKLIGQQLFRKMLPVDEYLPILFNVHPQ